MELAEAIVRPVLSKLEDLAVTEGKALAALGDEIKRLKEKLKWLNMMVEETDLRSRTSDNQQSRLLACQLREVVFSAEDVIDHFFLEADLSRFGNDWCQAAATFFSNFCTQICVRYVLSRKIRSMNTQLEDIINNGSKYGSDNGSTKVITWRASRAIPTLRPHWDDTDLVENQNQDAKATEDENQQGVPIRKDKEKELNKLLLDENGSLVIYVVGESGIGKRYLVKKAYENKTTKNNFGGTYLGELSARHQQHTDEIKRKLVDECSKQNMDQVKYLVVVDCPTSSTMLGDDIAQNLLKGRQGSKIVLTATFGPTADKNIGMIKLDYLPNPKSRTLFNRILGVRRGRQGAYQTQIMSKVRDYIPMITKGLPLAVVLLARFMKTMEYSRREAASDYIKDTNNDQDDVLVTIVSMGIDDLPNDFKLCLLYTAGFPERSTIDAGQLVRLWLAEGFLTQQLGVEVEPEELGQRYLKEFIFRGLMQLVKKKEDVVESVAIHERIHHIFKFEALRIGFMETVNHHGGYAPVTVSSRRLVLHSNKVPDKTNGFWKVRTVLSHDGHAHDAQGSQEFMKGFSQLLKESTFLRVISLEGINIGEKLLNQIEDMLHLQYLRVRCPTLTTVPDSITKLKKLQTMDVRGTQVTTLPVSFWNIKTLRHVLGNRDLQFPKFCETSKNVFVDRGHDHGLSVHLTIKEHVDRVC